MSGEAEAITLVREGMNRLRGRLFELVEATGMASKQEQAFKNLIRRQTYDCQGDVESALRREET